MPAFKKILVPIDLSEASRRALEHALQLGKVCAAQVDLLHVWEPPNYVTPDVMLAMPGFNAVSLEEFSVREARKSMQIFLEQADHPDLSPSTRIDSGEPSATILRAVREGGYDLVVMATHGRSRLHRFFLGSVAQRVVSQSPVPVLTIRGPETADEPAGAR
jgi:nucleotide-binding universal stress UspA family protein